MKIEVFSISPIFNISAVYESANALLVAREFAKHWSALTELTIDAPDRCEIWRGGKCVQTLLKDSNDVKFLAKHSGIKLIAASINNSILEAAYKKARINLHPDKLNGNHELFIEAEKVYHRLKKENNA